MKLPAIVLIALLPLGGCDIFLEDPGGEGMPCYEDNDCQKGLACDADHLCHKTPDGDFGKFCNPDNPGDCGGVFNDCICFLDNNCHCTRTCGDPEDCDDLPLGQGGARCTLTDRLDLKPFCALPEWSNGFGNLCNGTNRGCYNVACTHFEAYVHSVCSFNCTQCPAGTICAVPEGMEPETCGFSGWFGFWHTCGNNTECDTRFPMFPICRGNQNCTARCEHSGECPPAAHCVNYPGGDCVPDM